MELGKDCEKTAIITQSSRRSEKDDRLISYSLTSRTQSQFTSIAVAPSQPIIEAI